MEASGAAAVFSLCVLPCTILASSGSPACLSLLCALMYNL